MSAESPPAPSQNREESGRKIGPTPPRSGSSGASGSKRGWIIIILGVVLATAGATFYYFAEANVQRYRVVRQGNRIVVFRGLYLPWGERRLNRYIPVIIPEEAEIKGVDTFGSVVFHNVSDTEYQLYKLRRQIAVTLVDRVPDQLLPRDAALRRAYLVLSRAAMLLNLSRHAQDELDALRFRVMIKLARFHLTRVKAVEPKLWLGELTRGKLALYDALRLHGIGDRERELVDALLGDVYYLEGRVMLAQVTRGLIEARARFRKAQRREALIYRDADRWVKFIDARLTQFADLDQPFRSQIKRHLPLRVPLPPSELSETPKTGQPRHVLRRSPRVAPSISTPPRPGESESRAPRQRLEH
ncbi:MAG: hypothetical protein KC609_00440 [Myxococcales bacterium]|nr:hypothetical protein [Myxococcales bacterium]